MQPFFWYLCNCDIKWNFLCCFILGSGVLFIHRFLVQYPVCVRVGDKWEKEWKFFLLFYIRTKINDEFLGIWWPVFGHSPICCQIWSWCTGWRFFVGGRHESRCPWQSLSFERKSFQSKYYLRLVSLFVYSSSIVYIQYIIRTVHRRRECKSCT